MIGGVPAAILHQDKSNGGARISDYWASLPELVDETPLAIAWRGNQHNTRFLLAPKEPFYVLNDRNPDPDDAPIVPREALKAIFEPLYRELDIWIRDIRDRCPIFLLGSPPPMTRSKVRENFMRAGPLLRIVVESGLDPSEPPIAPDWLRVTAWELLAEKAAEVAGDLGIAYVPVPSSVQNEFGCLRDELAADATHANGAFGRIMMREITSRL
ncbi:SGNH/GDSL hydrolase family protein [Faunimonas sp. B44]|uniref:SGNH/GDSL hydrolase family protein n=1 Tax=Faunimonas sp. B44 TaxID=3461493 RepID=UPI0040448510